MAFDEAAACISIGAFNAACSMFRLTVDLATKGLIPDENDETGPTVAQRRTIFGRTQWLIHQGIISKDLEDLASCIREDGNDGVHDGTLGVDEAQDNLDFSDALLRRLFTEPARITIAKDRRDLRRGKV
ncbi:MAG: DUF4145 domain-containing protein [Sphingopyxis sp.]|nr:DUF4145 domain-containing protein [Sphingopyxis sp.]